MGHLSSSKGILALLRETDASIIKYALVRLLELIDTFWYEISPDLPLIEELYESEGLTEETRKLAALAASQVYFHLGEYNESVTFALAAGNAFDHLGRSIYTDIIFSRCIDLYVQHQECGDANAQIDPKLDHLFCSLAEKWIADEHSTSTVKELIGFIIRARRLDLLERVLKKHIETPQSPVFFNFTLSAANLLVRDIAFRRSILRLLASTYSGNENHVDCFSLAQCLLFLNDAVGTARLIGGLLTRGERGTAYQLAFDLYEYGSQEFLGAVSKELLLMGVVAQPLRQESADEAATEAPAEGAPAATSSSSEAGSGADTKLLTVLSGEVTTSMYLKFLYSRCNADCHILNNIKRVISARHSVLHSAIFMSHGLMYAGTTIDSFVRDSMFWLSKAQQWAMFNAVATFGAIHRGHVDEGMRVLETFLPKEDSVGPLPFQEAGSLYALGLIYSPLGVSRNLSTIEYLHNALRKYSASEQMAHGASLGLGLAAMGLNDEDLFDTLFTCVSGSDAVAGEAAALAAGLVMMGSGNTTALSNLKNLACEYNQKEKIIRGISMAMALMMLGREDESWPLVEEVLEHSDPWVRLGGCFTLGLAFAGTENTKAIECLLNVAVKDTSDDVRRNAVTMIGFVALKDPSLCLELTRVLVDSYNPHIRYGVAMALAVAGAGSGNSDVIDVLWLLKDDLSDIVRQGAYIALAIVMVELSEKENPRVADLRTLMAKVISDPKDEGSAKFGCIIATGLIDAGGRNCTFALQKQRHRLNKAVVGMFVFLQHWFWFPYTMMATLAMQPTCFIGLNENLEMPQYTFRSNAPPSQFDMPKSVLQQKKEVKVSGVKSVVLSTTQKEWAFRERRKLTGKGAGLLGETVLESPPKNPSAVDEAANTLGASRAGEKLRPLVALHASAEEEPHFQILSNPARITPHQLLVVSHDVDERYTLVKSNAMGVTILRDRLGEAVPEKLVDKIVPNTGRSNTAKPPEPFRWP